MKILFFSLFTFYILLTVGCKPAAAPVSISNRPVSVNDVPLTNQPLAPTKPLGEMTWATIDLETNAETDVSKLGNFQGKAVILDFWATNCPPCIAEIPHLKALQAKYGKENLEIVGMHVGDDEDREKVPAFAQKLKIDYPLAVPEDELTRFIFGKTTEIPQTAVFDRSGKLVRKITGFSDEIKRDLDAAVEQAVNPKS
ncbi:MAG TPA: TlpA disulfide reductase family protein [Pyrinomonadaceae bacterium]|jgi:thiol-disulfide isomerase/thioredoxin